MSLIVHTVAASGPARGRRHVTVIRSTVTRGVIVPPGAHIVVGRDLVKPGVTGTPGQAGVRSRINTSPHTHTRRPSDAAAVSPTPYPHTLRYPGHATV